MRAPKAKALGEQGCEVVKTDMDSKESLEQAISGSYGVFAVTNYWGLFGENQDTAKDREIQQGKNIGDICKGQRCETPCVQWPRGRQVADRKGLPSFRRKGNRGEISGRKQHPKYINTCLLLFTRTLSTLLRHRRMMTAHTQ